MWITQRCARPLSAAASSCVRAEHGRFHDRRDTNFLLFEVECVSGDADTFSAVLDSCEEFVADYHHIDPLLDRSPPTLVKTADGRNGAATHPETKRLMAAYRERGFAQMGELGLPFPVQCAASFTLQGAFSSNALGIFVLTRCAADLLEAHGSEALRAQWLAPLRTAEWTGTMALSEPHAGSSLAEIRTIATPHAGGAEGEYRIKGDKMWYCSAPTRNRAPALTFPPPSQPLHVPCPLAAPCLPPL